MNKILYSDEIIEIHSGGIVLRNIFPVLWNPKVLYEDILYIKVMEPTLSSGKYRISGTGDFRNWFNVDTHRPSRDKIFLIHRRNKWWRYGFTCENSREVINLLHDKIKLIVESKEKR